VVSAWCTVGEDPIGDHEVSDQGVEIAHRVYPLSFDAVALSLDKPVDWTMFGIWLTMLLHRHGNEVLRVKGILNVADGETPVAVHGVQHLVHPPTHMTAWPDTDRRSRLVFIVKGLAPAAIERSLRAFSMTSTAWRSPPSLCPGGHAF
jgi:G3E family GTPase